VARNYKEMIWEDYHYRFGLAGQGQADIIQDYLQARSGTVLYIGCGPRPHVLRRLSPYCSALIAADIEFGCLRALEEDSPLEGIPLCQMDANRLGLKTESMDFVLALGFVSALG